MIKKNKTSIRNVSAIALFLLTSIVFFFFGYVYYNYQKQLKLSQLDTWMIITNEQLAKGLSIAMWNFDEAEVVGVLECGLADKNMIAIEAEYYDKQGTIVSVSRSGRKELVVNGTRRSQLKDDLIFTGEITHEGDKLGKLTIFATTEYVYAELKEEFGLFVFYLLLSILLIIASVYFIFHFIVIKPIEALEAYALSINFGNYNPDQTIKKKFYRELEHLNQSLQTMVTSLNLNYKKLEESERKFRDMANLLPQIVFEMDLEGRFIFVNESGLEMFGLTREDLNRGVGVNNITRDENYARVMTNIQRLIKGEIILSGTEYNVLRKDGTLFPLMIYSSLVVEDNTPVGIRGVGIDLTDQRKSEKALLELQKLNAVALMDGQEKERHRISQEIHDGIGQMMTAIKLACNSVDTASINSEKESEKFEYVKSLVHEVIAELRQVSSALSPTFLYNYGLFLSINQLVLNVSKISRVQVEFSSNVKEVRFLSLAEITLYRIAQEALNNALKYSKASKIKIQLHTDVEFLELVIKDDGIGLDLSAMKEMKPSGGNGLKNMTSRAELIDANLEIVSLPGCGTEISLQVPLEKITCE